MSILMSIFKGILKSPTGRKVGWTVLKKAAQSPTVRKMAMDAALNKIKNKK